MPGQTNRVYEILNDKRQLALLMIKRLHKDLGIPAESLFGNWTAKSDRLLAKR